MTRCRLLVLALLLAAAPAGAATHPPDGTAPLPGPWPEPRPSRPPAVAALLEAARSRQQPIATLLRLQEPLELSPEQIYQLARLARETEQAVRQQACALEHRELAIAALLFGTRPDPDGAEAALRTLARAWGELRIERLRGVLRAWALLTPAQQTHLRTLGLGLEILAPLGPGMAAATAACDNRDLSGDPEHDYRR